MPKKPNPPHIVGWEAVPGHPGYYRQLKDDFIAYRPDLYPLNRPQSHTGAPMTRTDLLRLRVHIMKAALDTARADHDDASTPDTRLNLIRARASYDAATRALSPTE